MEVTLRWSGLEITSTAATLTDTRFTETALNGTLVFFSFWFPFLTMILFLPLSLVRFASTVGNAVSYFLRTLHSSLADDTTSTDTELIADHTLPVWCAVLKSSTI